jgi:hypothetical protein
MAKFYGTNSDDKFIGPNEVNYYYFETGELSSNDVIIGGTAADEIHFSGGQLLAWGSWNALANVSSVEFLYFDDLGDIVAIPDSMVTSTPGTAVYRLITRGGGGWDTIDASDVTSPLPIWIEGEDGNDRLPAAAAAASTPAAKETTGFTLVPASKRRSAGMTTTIFPVPSLRLTAIRSTAVRITTRSSCCRPERSRSQ